MRGVYTATAQLSAVSTARTLMRIQAPATAIVEILEAHVTDADNEVNEQLDIGLQRITTLNGLSDDSVVTPAVHEEGDGAFGGTVKANVANGSDHTYTADKHFGREGVASLSGYHYTPIPELRPTLAPGAHLGLKLHSAPTALILNVSITFRVIG